MPGLLQIGSAERGHWLLALDPSERHFLPEVAMPAHAVAGSP